MKKVVIVGAGVIGLMCALRLAQRGSHVVLLEGEKEDFSLHGPSASLAAAGMLAPISEMSEAAEMHDDIDALAVASFDLWRAQSKGALWEDGLRFGGGVVIAASDAQASRMQQGAAALGREVSPLSSGQWRKRTGLSTPIGTAMYIADEGVADPIRVLSGLAMDARRHGAQILFGHDVASVAGDGVVTFDHGRFEADHVLLTPGVWANDQMQQAAPALAHVRAARGHLVPVATERALDVNVHGEGFYLARRGENDVVLGATMEFDKLERHVDPERVAELLRAAERVLPGEIRQRDGVRAWTGVRPMTPDWAPMIGPSGDVFVACGHSRNGWLLAPITAEIICGYMCAEPLQPLWARFAPDRF